jgi:hypothetical protein
MRSNRVLIVGGIAAILAFTGCSKQEEAKSVAHESAEAIQIPQGASAGASSPIPVQEAMAPAAPEPPPADADSEMAAQVETDTRPTAADLTSSAASYQDGKRKFIRTAQAQFRVKDVYRSALAIEDAVAAQGGFVINNNIYAQTLNTQSRPGRKGILIELTEYTVRGDITVRVPSDNTQVFLRTIAGQMEFLDRRSFNAADAQLDILRQQLSRQREQETQQQIGQASQQGGRMLDRVDAISAQNNAKQQRDEALIQQKEFEDKVEFSTITLSLHQLSKIHKTEMPDVEAIFRDNSPGFFSRFGDSMRVGWYGVLDVFLALMQVWPLWLLIIVAFIGFRRWRASRRPPPLPKQDV